MYCLMKVDIFSVIMSTHGTAIQLIALDRPVVSEVGPGAAEAVATWRKGASTIIYMAQASHWL
jgi:hypothetical protein